MFEINLRKQKILQLVIHRHIHTAKPVGSRTLAEEYKIGLSPATIRNYLAELEEEGYLTHPHTSAGRVPTDKGYRLYVDNLIEAQRLLVEEREKVRREFYLRVNRLEDLLDYTSYLLARLSHYTGFVFSPRWEGNTLQAIYFVPAGERKILVNVVAKSGLVWHTLLESEKEVSEERLRRISHILNEKFSGLAFSELKEKFLQVISEGKKEENEVFDLAKKFLHQLLFAERKEQIYFEGIDNILIAPEFSDTGKLSNLFKFIEEKKLFSHWLKEELNKIAKKPKPEESKVKITIGSENPFPEMRDCSVIASVYQLDEQPVGILGILGPKRMEYSRMIGVVGSITQLVNTVLKKSKIK